MMLFLPLISIVYGGFLPAGLFIYWIVATIFSIVQQYLIVGWGAINTQGNQYTDTLMEAATTITDAKPISRTDCGRCLPIAAASGQPSRCATR